MKRYFIFKIEHYYPNGGMGDYCNEFDSIQECIDYCENELNLKGEKLKKLIKDCNITVEIWDMVDKKEIWNMYDLFNVKNVQ